MLVLERTPSSAILIGSDVRIEVLRTGTNRVLLGIQAPRHVTVRRAELPPLDRLPRPDDRVPPKLDPRTNPRQPAPQFKVLVVENDPRHAEIIRTTLEQKRSSKVTVSPSTESAITLLRQPPPQTPNLLLFGLHAPADEATQYLHALRLEEPLRETPIIVLGESSDSQTVRKFLSAGANAFVPRDPQPEAFTQSILCIADFWRQARCVA